MTFVLRLKYQSDSVFHVINGSLLVYPVTFIVHDALLLMEVMLAIVVSLIIYSLIFNPLLLNMELSCRCMLCWRGSVRGQGSWNCLLVCIILKQGQSCDP